MINPKVMKKQLSLYTLLMLLTTSSFSQNTSDFTPVKDNTIYSENSTYSNGEGDLFSGRTGISNGNNNRRALIEFDISSIPVGSTIIEVSLKIRVNKVSFSGDGTHNYKIYQVSKEWGEGTSLGGGTGAPAVAPDATWNDAMFGTSSWSTAGGDYLSTSLSSLNISGVGFYTFTSTSNFINAVQNWLDDSSTNNGILLIGDENDDNSARRFDSKEATNSNNVPVLSVTWSAPLSTSDLFKEEVILYPNPTSSYINLKNIDQLDIQSIAITNVLGKQIVNTKVFQSGIDVSNLNQGLYFLHITLSRGKYTKRFIKQ